MPARRIYTKAASAMKKVLRFSPRTGLPFGNFSLNFSLNVAKKAGVVTPLDTGVGFEFDTEAVALTTIVVAIVNSFAAARAEMLTLFGGAGIEYVELPLDDGGRGSAFSRSFSAIGI